MVSSAPGLLPNTAYVWGRTLRIAIESAATQGIPTARLLEGLPPGIQAAPDGWIVPWADYCQVIERIEVLAGGPDACEEMLARTYHRGIPEIRVLAGAAAGPKRFCRFLALVVTPAVFPTVRTRSEDLGGPRMRFTFELRDGARPCLAFFRGTVGTIRGCPRHLGLPEARVVASIEPSRAVYDVIVPPPPPRIKALRDASRAILGVAAERLGAKPEDSSHKNSASTAVDRASLPEAARLLKAEQTWGLTVRQSEVLGLLVHGRANKQIAHAQGCAENTVELHVTNLLRKAGVSSRAELISRFWNEL